MPNDSYEIEVGAKLSSAAVNVVDGISSKLNEIKNIKINLGECFDTSGLTGISSQVSNLTKQFATMGEQASSEFNKAFNRNMGKTSFNSNGSQIVKNIKKQVDDVTQETSGKKIKLNFDETAIEKQGERLKQIGIGLNNLNKSATNPMAKSTEDSLKKTEDLYKKVYSQFESFKNMDLSSLDATKVNDSWKELYNDIGLVSKKYSTLTKDNTAQQAMAQRVKMAKDYQQQIDNLINNNGKIQNSAKYLNKLTDMKSSFSKNNVQQLDPQEWVKATSDFKTLKNELQQMGVTSETTMQKIGSSIKSNLQFVGVTAGISAASLAIKEMVSSVTSLDTAMSNLRMVTGKNESDTKSLVDSYAKMGQQYGATTTDVANGANEWLRQGFSIEDTNKLLKSTLTLSKTSDMNSSDASKYLTSALKGYKEDASQAVDVTDKLNAVDLKSATSAAGLAEAMSKTANTANQSGVSMSKLLGYLASTMEVTQGSPETVGTAFKSIFTRMANIKAKYLADPETGESFSDVETVLKSNGINLRDETDTFRNFGDVLDEVAKNWTNYSSVQQAAIAKAFAGQHQQEIFRTLMANYNNAETYEDVANDSSGSASKKMDIYVDSIEGRLKTFQSAFEELSQSTINGGFLKNLISFGTSAINVFTTLQKQFGAFPMLLGSISGILGVTGKNNGILKAISPFGTKNGRFTLFGSNSDEIKTEIKKNKEQVSKSIEEAYSSINYDSSPSKIFGTKLKSFGSGAGSVFSNIFSSLSNGASTAGTKVKSVFTKLGSNIKDGAITAFTGVKESVTSTFLKVSSGIGTGINAGINNIKNIGSNVKGKISSAFSGMKSIVNQSYNDEMGSFGGDISPFKSFTLKFKGFTSLPVVGVSNVISSIQSIANKLKTSFVKVKSSLSNSIKEIKTSMQTSYDEAFASFDGNMSPFKAFSSKAKGLFSGLNSQLLPNFDIGSGIKSALDKMYDGIKNTFTNIKTSIGSFGTNIKTGISNIKATFEKVQSNLISSIENIKTNFSNIKTNMQKSFNDVYSTLGDNTSFFKSFGTKLSATGKAFSTGIQTSFSNLYTSISNIDISKIPTIFKNVASKIKTAFTSVKTNISNIKTSMQQSYNDMYTDFGGDVSPVKALSSKLKGFGSGSIEALSTGFSSIATGFQASINKVKSTFGKLSNNFKSSVNSIKATMKASYNEVYSSLGNDLSPTKVLGTKIKALGAGTSSLFSGISNTLFSGIDFKSTFSKAGNSIKEGIANLRQSLSGISESFSGIFSGTKVNFSNIFSGLKNGLSNAKNSITNEFSSLKESFTTGYNNVFSSLGNSDSVTSSLGAKIKGIFSGIKNIFKSNFSTLTPEVKSMLSTLNATKSADLTGLNKFKDEIDTGKFKDAHEALEELKKSYSSLSPAARDAAIAMAGLNSVEERSGAISNYTTKIDEQVKATEKLTVGNKIKSGLKGIVAGIGDTVAGVGIGMAIDAGLSAIDYAIHYVENKMQESKDLINQHDDKSSQIEENIKTVDSVSSQFTELSKGVDSQGNNVKLTTDQFAEYNQIVSQLISINPALQEGVNATGQAFVNQATAIKDAKQALQDQKEVEAASYRQDFSKIYEGQKDSYEQGLEGLYGKTVGEHSTIGTSGKILGLFSNTYSGAGGYFSPGADKLGNVKTTISKLTGLPSPDIIKSNGELSLQAISSIVDRKDTFLKAGENGLFSNNKWGQDEVKYWNDYIDKLQVDNQKIKDTETQLTNSVAKMYSNESWYKNIQSSGMSNVFSNTLKSQYEKANGSWSDTEYQQNAVKLGKQFETNTKTIQPYIDSLNKLDKEKKDGKISAEEYNKQETDLQKKLSGLSSSTKNNDSLKGMYDELANRAEKAAQATESLSDKTKDAMEQIQNALGGAVDKYDALNKVLDKNLVKGIFDAQGTGNTVDIDSYQAAATQITGLSDALHYNNGALQVDVQQAQTILDKYTAEQETAVMNERAQVTTQQESIQAQLTKLNTAKQLTDEQKTQRDSLNNDLQTLQQEAQQYDILIAKYAEMRTGYYHWQQVQKAPEAGQELTDAETAYKQIDEAINKTGRVGTIKYKAAVQFLMPSDVKPEDVNAVRQYKEKLSRYFTQNDDGEKTFSGLQNFLTDSKAKGLMTEDNNGKYNIVKNTKIDDFIKKLHLTKDVTTALFGDLSEYGAKFDWSDEFFNDFSKNSKKSAEDLKKDEETLAQLKTQAKVTTASGIDSSTNSETSKNLTETYAKMQAVEQKKLQLAQPVDINIKANLEADTQIKQQESAIDQLKTKLKSATDPIQKIKIQANIDQAQEKLNSLKQQKATLTQPSVMSINAQLEVNGSQEQSLQQALNNYKTANGSTSMTVKSSIKAEFGIDAGATDAEAIKAIQGALDNLKGQNSSLTAMLKLQAKFETDNTANGVQQGIQKAFGINGKESEVAVHAAITTTGGTDAVKILGDVKSAADVINSEQVMIHVNPLNIAGVEGNLQGLKATCEEITSKPYNINMSCTDVATGALYSVMQACSDLEKKQCNIEVSAPNAGTTTQLLNAVTSAANSVPKKVSTQVSAPGAYEVIGVLSSVVTMASLVPRNISSTITTTQKTVHVDVNGGKGSVNGNMHINSFSGQANASGTSNSVGGKTLVGELGAELMVNPRTGTWNLVGEHGAEFVEIPKNAIVFNHKQTQSLIDNGYVAGRGEALVNGNANKSGKALISGGGFLPPTNPSSGVHLDERSKKQTKADEKAAKAKEKNTKATEKNTKATDKNSDSKNTALENYDKQISHNKNMGQYDSLSGQLEYIHKLQYEEKNLAKTQDEKWKVQEEIYSAQKAYQENLISDAENTISHIENMGKAYETTGWKVNALINIQKKYAKTQEQIKKLDEEIYKARIDMFNAQKEQQDKYKEHASEANENIKSLQELAQQYVQKQYDLEKEVHQKRITALNDEKDKETKNEDDILNKIQQEIDKRKKLLEEKKDENDWNSQLSDSNKKIADLEAERAALGDSDSARKRKNEINNELRDAQKDRKNMLFEHDTSEQEKALDNEGTNAQKRHDDNTQAIDDKYKKLTDKEQNYIDQIEEYTSKEVNIRDEANKLIDEHSQVFYNNLKEYCKDYTDYTSSQFEDIYKKGIGSLQEYSYDGHDKASSVREYLEHNLDMYTQGIKDIETAISNAGKTGIASLDSITKKFQDGRPAVKGYVSDISNVPSIMNGFASSAASAIDKTKEEVQSLNEALGKTVSLASQATGSLNGNNNQHSGISPTYTPHYANGILDSRKKHLANIDELGKEMIVSRPQMGRISQIQYGDSVIPSNPSKTLMAIGENPSAFFSKYIKGSTSIRTSQALNAITNNSTGINFNIDVSGASDEGIIKVARNEFESMVSTPSFKKNITNAVANESINKSHTSFNRRVK